MSEQFAEFKTTTVENWDQGMDVMDKLLRVAQPDAVFGEPIEAQGQTVLTASEVVAGLGFGFGGGAGGNEPQAEGTEGTDESPDEVEAEEPQQESVSVGGGMGGGGGGKASGRPVAVIHISKEGVKVEPIVDITKIALAAFTTLGSMFFMLQRMKRAGRR